MGTSTHSRRPAVLAIAAGLVMTGAFASVPSPTHAAAKPKVVVPKPVSLKLGTNVRAAAVVKSRKFIVHGVIDSKQPALGKITIACRGVPKYFCVAMSEVKGKIPFSSFTTNVPSNFIDNQIGNRPSPSPGTPGSNPPATDPAGSKPPSSGGGDNAGGTPPAGSTPPDETDLDLHSKGCIFKELLCWDWTYDEHGDGVMASPDGKGDTVDGLPGTFTIHGL